MDPQTSQVYRAPWRTFDGEEYPIRYPVLTQIRWHSDIEIEPLAAMPPFRVVWCGPDAPFPTNRVNRQSVFERACGLAYADWQHIATLEAGQGIFLDSEGSLARRIWERVYKFRPYELVSP